MVLTDHGITLDSISASNMQHVLDRRPQDHRRRDTTSMNTSAMEKELEQSVSVALQAGSDLPRITPRAEQSLPDMIAQLERINRAADEKIRRERMTIRNTYERQLVEVRTVYETRISDEVSKLEQARDTELLALTEETSRKLHDLERLARRQG